MKYRAWAYLVICNLFWAGNMIFGKYAAVGFSPIWTVFLRWAIALLFLVPLAQVVEKPSWLQIGKKNGLMLVAMAVVGVVVYNYLMYASLQYTSSFNGALINALTPALIMLFSLIFFKDKIGGFQLFGLLISFLGVLTVLTKGNIAQVFYAHYNKGDAIMLAAILFWTAYSLIGKKAVSIPPITMVAMTAFIGVVIMFPFAVAHPLQAGNITSSSLTGIIYMGIFPSVGSFILWNKGIGMLGAGTAGTSMNLIPVFTAIIAVLLGHGLALSQIVGGAIVIAGMLLASLTKKARAPKIPELPRSAILGKRTG